MGFTRIISKCDVTPLGKPIFHFIFFLIKSLLNKIKIFPGSYQGAQLLLKNKMPSPCYWSTNGPKMLALSSFQHTHISPTIWGTLKKKNHKCPFPHDLGWSWKIKRWLHKKKKQQQALIIGSFHVGESSDGFSPPLSQGRKMNAKQILIKPWFVLS